MRRAATYLAITLSAFALGQTRDSSLAKGNVFYVSKIGTSPQFTKERADELWHAFRSQYFLAESGRIIQYERAKKWVQQIQQYDPAANRSSKDSFKEPTQFGVYFTVIKGLDKDGKPLSDYVYGKVTMKDPKTAYDGTDVRFKTELEGNTATLYLSDRTAVFPKQSFISCEDADQQYFKSHGGRRVLMQEANMPNNKEAQDAFLDALKAGSLFRVVLQKEVSCNNCEGAGQLTNSKSQRVTCSLCSGKGSLKKVEIVTFAW